jgi:hypothetical protein
MLVFFVRFSSTKHTAQALSSKRHLIFSSNGKTWAFYHYLAMRNTADVTGGKPIAICAQSISGVNIIIISLLMSLLLGHRSSLWITYMENGP